MTSDRWTNPREAALDKVRDTIEEKKQTVEGGPLDGTEVVTIEDISEAFRVPLDPPSDYTAEVLTPSVIYVDGVCPNCKEIAALRMDLTTELRIETSGRHLRLKGKSKEVTHYCGQQRLPDGVVEGQTTFDIADIVNRGEDEAITSTELQALLDSVGVEATIEAIDSWTEPDRETVRTWAVATFRKQTADETEAETIEVPEYPSDIFASFDAAQDAEESVEVEEAGDQEEQTDGDGNGPEADDQPKRRRKR